MRTITKLSVMYIYSLRGFGFRFCNYLIYRVLQRRSKSSTFSLRKLNFQAVKVELLECKSNFWKTKVQPLYLYTHSAYSYTVVKGCHPRRFLFFSEAVFRAVFPSFCRVSFGRRNEIIALFSVFRFVFSLKYSIFAVRNRHGRTYFEVFPVSGEWRFAT